MAMATLATMLETDPSTFTDHEETPETNLEYKLKLETTRKNAASWLSAIALFTIINAVIFRLSDGNLVFIIGLGITQLIDAVALYLSDTLAWVSPLAFGISLILAGMFAWFGRLAKQGVRAVSIAGMILYGLDSFIFLWVQDFLGLAFHGFALFMIYKGVKAQNELKQFEKPKIVSVPQESFALVSE